MWTESHSKKQNMQTLIPDLKRLIFQYASYPGILIRCPTPGILQHFITSSRRDTDVDVLPFVEELIMFCEKLKIQPRKFTGDIFSWVEYLLCLDHDHIHKRRILRIHSKMKKLLIKCICATFSLNFWNSWKQETQAWIHLRKHSKSILPWESLQGWFLLIREVSSLVKVSNYNVSSLLTYPLIHRLNSSSWIEIDQIPDSLLNQLSYQELFNLHPKEKSSVLNGKREIDAHRWYKSYLKTPPPDSCYSPTYMFADLKNDIPSVLPEPFQPLYSFMNRNSQFNHVQVNWFENGRDYIPYHSDWEKGKTPDSDIAIVSLNPPQNKGTSRILRLKAKQSGEQGLSIPLIHGRIVRMCGATQSHYRHSVLHEYEYPFSRISVTFRSFE
jgi:alkylated DNA repair dioxygenase AlkB